MLRILVVTIIVMAAAPVNGEDLVFHWLGTEAAAKLADEIDASVAKLDPSDQTVIHKIQALIVKGKAKKLMYAVVGRLSKRIKDPDQQEFWAMVLYLADQYTYRPNCANRDAWLSFFFIPSLGLIKDEACMKALIASYSESDVKVHHILKWRCFRPNQPAIDLYIRADQYINTRTNRYDCQEMTVKR